MPVFYFYLSPFYLYFITEFIEKRIHPIVYTCTDNDDFVSFFKSFSNPFYSCRTKESLFVGMRKVST